MQVDGVHVDNSPLRLEFNIAKNSLSDRGNYHFDSVVCLEMMILDQNIVYHIKNHPREKIFH